MQRVARGCLQDPVGYRQFSEAGEFLVRLSISIPLSLQATASSSKEAIWAVPRTENSIGSSLSTGTCAD